LSTQAGGRREKEFSTTQYKFFGLIFEQSEVFYLYKDFVIVLVKIAATVTLIDKIKMELIHNQFNNTCG